MNNEIKKILKILKECEFGACITEHSSTVLLDYITNLQKTNKNHSKKLIELGDKITNLQQKIEQYENPDDMTLFYMWLDVKAKDKIKDLQQENERLKEANKILEENWKHYMMNCSKAIEYIKSNTVHYTRYLSLEKTIISKLELKDNQYNILLNILQK